MDFLDDGWEVEVGVFDVVAVGVLFAELEFCVSVSCVTVVDYVGVFDVEAVVCSAPPD